MSSTFRSSRGVLLAIAIGLLAAPGHAAFGPASPLRFADVVTLPGNELPGCLGQRIDSLAVVACTPEACRPIPFQVDERDPTGRWVLDHGPLAAADDPPGVFDDNDLLLFMAADAGARASHTMIDRLAGAPEALAEIEVHDPLARTTRYVYVGAFATRPPRSPTRYVAYDPDTDRVHRARVSLGFAAGVPAYLAVHDGARACSGASAGSQHDGPTVEAPCAVPDAGAVNVLDRLKVRASATFLFGLIRFSRSEADLRTEFMGWRAGAIRVVRGQRQWVRLGWGIRSPTFGSYTYFYRDCAELPVGLRLNFKPTHFFGNIVVQTVLDFRDLSGWSLVVPSLPGSLPIGTMTAAQRTTLEALSDRWFAAVGPRIALVQSMGLSPSLASVRHRLIYRESTRPEPPEAVAGEAPGIGYRLDRWEHVGAGAHQLESVSYALPADFDVRAFMAIRRVPLVVRVGEARASEDGGRVKRKE